MHRIVSWNVNGLRACVSKGFRAWFDADAATIVGLQEVRAHEGQLPREVVEIPDWHRHVNPAERPGYSGVGLYARHKPDHLDTKLGEERFDV